jgi:hypothetical protein
MLDIKCRICNAKLPLTSVTRHLQAFAILQAVPRVSPAVWTFANRETIGFQSTHALCLLAECLISNPNQRSTVNTVISTGRRHLYPSVTTDLIAQVTRYVFKHVQGLSGFGGLEVACWPLVSKFSGSYPAEAVEFLGRKNPQHAFLRRVSKAVRLIS